MPSRCRPTICRRALTSKDYPNLIPEGDRVDTIAVPAVLAAYNWAPNTERYRKLAQFVDAFFTKFPTFQNPPFHPKWKEVSLSDAAARLATPAGRRAVAQAHNVGCRARRFDEFLRQSPTTAATIKTDADRETLFKQFQAWETERNAQAQSAPIAEVETSDVIGTCKRCPVADVTPIQRRRPSRHALQRGAGGSRGAPA